MRSGNIFHKGSQFDRNFFRYPCLAIMHRKCDAFIFEAHPLEHISLDLEPGFQKRLAVGLGLGGYLYFSVHTGFHAMIANIDQAGQAYPVSHIFRSAAGYNRH